jgi:hypothetical protein
MKGARKLIALIVGPVVGAALWLVGWIWASLSQPGPGDPGYAPGRLCRSGGAAPARGKERHPQTRAGLVAKDERPRLLSRAFDGRRGASQDHRREGSGQIHNERVAPMPHLSLAAASLRAREDGLSRPPQL